MVGVDASYVYAGASVLMVEIEDMMGKRRTFTFMGGGLSVGFRGGITGESAWVPFQTPQPCYVEDFEGSGSIIVPPQAALLIGFNTGLNLIFFTQGVRVYVPWDYGFVQSAGATLISVFWGYWHMRDAAAPPGHSIDDLVFDDGDQD